MEAPPSNGTPMEAIMEKLFQTAGIKKACHHGGSLLEAPRPAPEPEPEGTEARQEGRGAETETKVEPSLENPLPSDPPVRARPAPSIIPPDTSGLDYTQPIRRLRPRSSYSPAQAALIAQSLQSRPAPLLRASSS